MNHQAGLLDIVLQTFPLWLVGIFIFSLCLIAREIGVWFFTRRAKAHADANGSKQTDAQSHVISAIFGLLAFMLSLTFSIALDRFDSRKSLAIDEANAIHATYLRASLFDEPDRSRLQTTVYRYAKSRIAPTGVQSDQIREQLRESRAIRDRLWKEARIAVMPVRDNDRAASFIEGIAEMFALGERRQIVGQGHIPGLIMYALLLFLFSASVVLGYLLREEKHPRRAAATVLQLLIILVFMMILDLDRPQQGFMRVEQRALLDFVTWIEMDMEKAR